MDVEAARLERGNHVIGAVGLILFAVGIPLYGRIADLYSLRRVFSLGLLVLAIHRRARSPP